MTNITKEADMQVQHIISHSIAEFAYEYGFEKKFKEQSAFFDLFNQKISNQGYSEKHYPSISSGLTTKLPTTQLGDGFDYEELFLESWQTNVGGLNPIFAEQFFTDTKLCWYITYQLTLPGNIYTASAKYWEDSNPQLSIFRREL
ncbi:hypothetical protein [Polynucleobacter sp. MWH-S4W17]|uniref:hypothetical protein n=1 Tax=Polynucleobacter sp. MWH-S4W17 TaxID=1855910 RepID=UPI001BFEA85E|nr:hypothetical protein [Polynucleobacter sp. MWH-S4W17]QWD81600.1 hypothetical protein C2755_10230 [Polynucleobacter sp. MWH-S4W17]